MKNNNETYANLLRQLKTALRNGGEDDSLVRCLRHDLKNHPDHKGT